MSGRRVAQHGTRSKYVAGCRCADCSQANRDYQRDYMAERYAPSQGANNHGYWRNDGTIREVVRVRR